MSGTSLPRSSAGRLFVVATPIGNLEDLTFRALKTLKSVEVIACEDTRHTLKLLNRYELKKKLISYFRPREKEKIPQILAVLEKGGDVALVSDAGTPGISDPGFPLIREALARNIEVIPIPGVAAVTAALSAAGLPTHRFVFMGFPPVKRTAARKWLAPLEFEEGTAVIYLPPRKLLIFLDLIEEILGPREVVVARELTKLHEEFARGTPEELKTSFEGRAVKGEITLLVGGKKTRRRKSD